MKARLSGPRSIGNSESPRGYVSCADATKSSCESSLRRHALLGPDADLVTRSQKHTKGKLVSAVLCEFVDCSFENQTNGTTRKDDLIAVLHANLILSARWQIQFRVQALACFAQ